VKNLEVTNTTEEELFKKPFTVKYEVEYPDFLESAGNKFVFKVGQTIGPQVEMYADGKRKWPADVYYTHSLQRNISVNIPPGYSPTNLRDLEILTTCVMNGDTAAVFRSSARIADKTIQVTVYEDYREIEYPLEHFEAFRSVINAAADFNKKNIIFEKK
jgi:hypothetical protein